MSSCGSTRRPHTHLLAGWAGVLALSCSTQQAWFTPDDDVISVIRGEFGAAAERIHIAIYTFSLEELGNALQEAALRGVEVKVLADEGQSLPVAAGGSAGQYEILETLEDAGITVCRRNGQNGGILHHKFAVLDDKAVLTGSVNYTQSGTGADPDARVNLENLVLLVDPQVNEQYEAAFQELWTCE